MSDINTRRLFLQGQVFSQLATPMKGPSLEELDAIEERLRRRQ
jgi:hypothetical protein